MNRIDIMVDLETLGVGECPPLLQITAIPFSLTDENENFKGLEYNRVINIENINSINGKTLKWWFNTDKELLADLVNGVVGEGKIDTVSEAESVRLFVDFINKLKHHYKDAEVYLWGNGILFDNRILSNKCKCYGYEYPIFYRNDRDVRTISELAALKLGMASTEDFRKSIENTGRPHNAHDDVLYQIKCVQKAYEILMGNREDFWN